MERKIFLLLLGLIGVVLIRTSTNSASLLALAGTVLSILGFFFLFRPREEKNRKKFYRMMFIIGVLCIILFAYIMFFTFSVDSLSGFLLVTGIVITTLSITYLFPDNATTGRIPRG